MANRIILAEVLQLPPSKQKALAARENKAWQTLNQQVRKYFEDNYQSVEAYLLRHLCINLVLVGIVFFLLYYCEPSVVIVIGLSLCLAFAHSQIGFLMHGFAHNQGFTKYSRGTRYKLNTYLGLFVTNFLLMYSHYAWKEKHDAHHSHSNQVDHDPDLEIVLALHKRNGMRKKNLLWTLITMFQGILFYPFLASFQGFIMRKKALIYPLKTRHKGWKKHLTLTILGMLTYVGLIFGALPFWYAVLFLLVNQWITGIYLVASFAFNHKAEAKIPEDAVLSFARQQVETSCNVRGRWLVSYLLGGLNMQIEHHLFREAPYHRMWKVRDMVREFCIKMGFEYTEKSFLKAQWDVLVELHRLGYWERKKLPHFLRRLMGDLQRDNDPFFTEPQAFNNQT